MEGTKSCQPHVSGQLTRKSCLKQWERSEHWSCQQTVAAVAGFQGLSLRIVPCCSLQPCFDSWATVDSLKSCKGTRCMKQSRVQHWTFLEWGWVPWISFPRGCKRIGGTPAFGPVPAAHAFCGLVQCLLCLSNILNPKLRFNNQRWGDAPHFGSI